MKQSSECFYICKVLPTIVRGGGKCPSASIQDVNDPNKCAVIFIDVVSYKVRGFDVREVVRETLQE